MNQEQSINADGKEKFPCITGKMATFSELFKNQKFSFWPWNVLENILFACRSPLRRGCEKI